MSSKKSSGQTGFLLGLLGIAFVVLKLCGVINWSWWWVTLPFWVGIAVVLLMLLVAGLIGGIVYLSKDDKNKTKEPTKSKWEERLEEIKQQQIRKREQSEKHN